MPQSEVVGVYYNRSKHFHKWFLQLTRRGRMYHGGWFDTREEAEAAQPAWLATLPPPYEFGGPPNNE